MTDVDATFVAEYDYKAQSETELTISAGDTVRISRVEGDWMYGRHNITGKEGWVASSYGHLRQESPYQHMQERVKATKRKERFDSIVRGEAEFLTSLRTLVDGIIAVINVRDTPFKRTFLNDPSVAVSFNLLSEMHKACSSFHAVLSVAKSDMEICTAYTHFAPSLQLFAQYASENSKLLHAVERSRRDLSALLGDAAGSLAPSLILPLQHYPLYKTDFQDFVWLSPGGQQYELLCSALDVIIAQSEFVDVKLKEEADSLLLLNLQSKFSGNPVIFTPTRRLLREGEVERVRQKSTGEVETKLYYAHLFNDALIYSSRTLTGYFKLHAAIDFKGARFELHEIGGVSNGFTLYPAEKGGKAEHFRLLTKEEALDWFPLFINQIEVLKTKRIERRTSTIVKPGAGLSAALQAVKPQDLGVRGGILHRFLCSEMQFAEAASALNVVMVQPLIDASKGAVLSAAPLEGVVGSVASGRPASGPASSSEAYDSKAANTTRYQTQVITDALQEPDILIFLRAAEGIALAAREFSRLLETLCCAAQWKEATAIGAQFTSVNALALYNQLKSYAAGQQAMVRVLKTPPFAAFARDCEGFLQGVGGSLLEKIELPRKRIKTYLHFVTELRAATPANHADHEPLGRAIAALENMSAEIEELLRIKKNFEALLAIQASLVTLNTEPVVQKLVTMDRTFLKEGDLKKVCRKKNKLFRFWLFSDLLLYGAALGGDKFTFHRALELHKCSVAPHTSSDLKHALEIFGAEKSFVVIAASAQQCADWLESLRAAVEAVKRARGIDPTEASSAPLWTPDHSADNCPVCQKPFTFFNRRHHCRKCGLLMCSAHLNSKELLPHIHRTQKQKVCDDCVAGKSRVSSLPPATAATNAPSPSSAPGAAPSASASAGRAGASAGQPRTARTPSPTPAGGARAGNRSPSPTPSPTPSPAPAAQKPVEVQKLKSKWPPEPDASASSPAPVSQSQNPISKPAAPRAASPKAAASASTSSKPAWPPASSNAASSAAPAAAPASSDAGVKKASKFTKRTSVVASKLASAHSARPPSERLTAVQLPTASAGAGDDLPATPPPPLPSSPPPLPATPPPLPDMPPPPPVPSSAPAPPAPSTRSVPPPRAPAPLSEVPGATSPGPSPAPSPAAAASRRPPPPPPPPSTQRAAPPPPPPAPPAVPAAPPAPLGAPPAPPAAPPAPPAARPGPPPLPPAQPPSAHAPAPAAANAASPDDPLYRFRKMKEMLPEGAVRQKMAAEGFSPADIDAFMRGQPIDLPAPVASSGLASALQNVSLSAPAPAAPPSAGPKGGLLGEILAGPKLRAVAPAEAAPAAKLQGAGGILGMLAEEMSKRRVNIAAAHQEASSSDSDSSGFSDSDSD